MSDASVSDTAAPVAAATSPGASTPGTPASDDWGLTPGLPEEAYEHDGQITKREVRAVTLALLAPRPGELLWDVGGGSGSIGIEWLRAHESCRAVTVEPRADRAERITRNAATLGAPGLEVVVGRAPEALDGLPTPDAVFVGGGLTAPGLLDLCLAALRPGGRIVANAVTHETEALLLAAHRRHGGFLGRIAVERVGHIGGFTAWTPSRAITTWSATIGS
ncbi:precorrin-6Y C5,15-methyltransferase (decarboxylating) subunit CbiT [Mobilicoccus pelagius]|uniref:precorrin-6Y C5,15-methyltransferase (decarboxylating) subunit CbiT n=1 Tax=Mobilicoccus pelagius TaxID=746032 RepID=UPI0002E48406|nr:precorrin-6Y C5,15-methyltransferase (decarboxylating) subunit CbiT [Mobilicoccus pelagius]